MLLLNTFTSKAQQVFYQDICNCGVTGAGFSTSGGSGSGSFHIYIEPGSTIRKAWLFTQRYGDSKPSDIIINGIIYNFNTMNQVTLNYYIPYVGFSAIHAIDVTNDINPNITTYNVTIPYQSNVSIPHNPNIVDANIMYNVVYLWVEYEQIGLSKINSLILLNNFESDILNANYLANNLAPINTSYPVGFAICSDRLGDTLPIGLGDYDGSQIYVNSNLLGLIGGSDNNCSSWSGAGVKGSFYSQNNVLYGLEDDTPDAIMAASDGLADVSSYINNNDISFNFNLQWQDQFSDDRSNIYQSFFLTYTTPCDTFTVNLLTEDTTVCKGESVQLGASGGGTGLTKPAYEWLPTTGLSCSNCANPIASPDSTTYYTVRVWSTDSCSKVLPVRVKVLPLPKFTSIVTTPSACGVSTGSTTAVSTSSTGSLASADSLFSNGVYVGKAPKTIANLSAGYYTLYLVDTNSCKSEDTTVTINSVNLTNALFTLNPTTGAVPLTVSSDNQSTHATDYNWYFQHDSTTITSPSFEFDTSGTYTITLIAYNNTPDCSDTFSLQIVVYDSFQLIIPNVFTPNGDNQNDVFSIQVNAPCTGTITITNRWGNEIFSKNISTNGKQKLLIWNSMTANGKASDGVYFYSLSLRDKKNKEYHFQGFVELVR